MAAITGYKCFTSNGGNKCLHCGTKMRKGLPFMSPVSGKTAPHQLKSGKAICVFCIQKMMDDFTDMLDKCDPKDLDIYATKRFVAHLD
jgi:hypothetical protein